MRDEGEVLLRAAEAVSERRTVDWKQESRNDDELRRKLAHLKVVDAIATAHGVEVDSEPTGDARATGGTQLPADLPFPTWGPLRLLERIGKGGFGEVYRAHDPTLERDVALKLLIPGPAWDSDHARRFQEEARKLARVRHPNVLAVHGVDEHEGRIGIWTDLLRGRDLEALLALQGPLGPEEATVIGMDLCRALAAVHNAGLVHRDVKTSNIMREEGGRIVLMDFGTVADVSSEISSDTKNSGTPLFMAPEVLDGSRGGVTADVYSLGVVLYRLVTGKFPVEARTLREVRQKHRHGGVRTLIDARPDLPSGYVNVVNRCLARDPEGRFSSMGEMEQSLSASRAVPAPAPVPQARLQRFLPAAALAAVIAVVLWNLIPPPPTLTVEAKLFRAGAETDDRLLRDATVRLGDELFLEVKSSHAAYFYVFEEDQTGRAYVLFPLPEIELQNPLPVGAHRLPGEVNWKVSSIGGTETIFLIASRERLTDLEERLATTPKAGFGVPYEADNQVLAQSLRGIGGLTIPEKTEHASGRRLSAIFDDISQEQWRAKGIHVWEMALRNPGG